MELLRLHKVPHLMHRLAAGLFQGSQIDQQPLPHAGTEGVHCNQLKLRILLLQLPCRHSTCVEGAAQTGGEAQIEDVVTGDQLRFHDRAEHGHIDRAGGGLLASLQLSIELFKANGTAVRVIEIGLAVQVHRQGDHTDAHLLQQGGGQVTRGIGNNGIISHDKKLLMAEGLALR